MTAFPKSPLGLPEPTGMDRASLALETKRSGWPRVRPRQRLTTLSQNVVVPKELLDAADELRLLGNDAAHVKAKNYDAIGKDEASLAIELAKELLKAFYQYTSLVDRLKALKKP